MRGLDGVSGEASNIKASLEARTELMSRLYSCCFLQIFNVICLRVLCVAWHDVSDIG